MNTKINKITPCRTITNHLANISQKENTGFEFIRAIGTMVVYILMRKNHEIK